MKISYHPAVKKDLRGSYTHYKGIDPELALSFMEKYREALAFIKRDPLVMRTFYKNDRRMLLKRFKSYAVVYEVTEEMIVIKAVADLRRKPYFWSDR